MNTVLGPDLYAGWRESDLGAITEALEDRLLFALMGDVAGKRVLDVGCGEGALAVNLQGKGAIVTAADPSWPMIAAARDRAAEANASVALAQARGEQLPFADAGFDLVIAKTVLCFVGDGQPFVSEMARVLRPGGRFVIGELNKWSSWAAQRRLRAWFGSTLWQRGRFRTPGELRRLARTAGLEVEALQGAVYYPRVRAAARSMAPFDATLARWTTVGAAFIALAAVKPASS
jgi:2-polyprenyl-3-methyl-5-hydroxy-6-metoxy-1,4-benzoquinol methylase